MRLINTFLIILGVVAAFAVVLGAVLIALLTVQTSLSYNNIDLGITLVPTPTNLTYQVTMVREGETYSPEWREKITCQGYDIQLVQGDWHTCCGSG